MRATPEASSVQVLQEVFTTRAVCIKSWLICRVCNPPTHTYTTASDSSPSDPPLLIQPWLYRPPVENTPGQPACRDAGTGHGGILPLRTCGKTKRIPESWGRRLPFGNREKYHSAAQNPSQKEKAFLLNKTTEMNIGCLSCLGLGWFRLTPDVFVKKGFRSDSFSIYH
jgi:hypothetical protein